MDDSLIFRGDNPIARRYHGKMNTWHDTPTKTVEDGAQKKDTVHEITPTRKSEGFHNEAFFVLPADLLTVLAQDALFAPLRVADIGYFPKAHHHAMARRRGCSAAILLYCHDGWGTFQVGEDAERTLLPGQAVLIPPNMPHWYRASLEQPWSVYWMHITGTQLPAYLTLLGDEAPLQIHPKMTGEILREFHRCFALLNQHCQTEEFFLVCQSAGSILALILQAAKLSRQQLTDKGEQAVETCIRFMEAHLNQSIDMKALTATAGFSASHLSALFKRSTGYAPMAYFLRMKMGVAARELFFTGKSVKEIGLAFGIRDPYYFSRLFKGVMGVSPVKYREQTIG